MSDGPLVSVIVPTIDRPTVLRQCLDHLRRQDYPHLETIVVDSSFDRETTKSLMTRYPEVKYLYEDRFRDNPGVLRNLGATASRGKILAFLDDDCLAAPDWISCLVRGYVDESVGGVGGRLITEGVKLPPEADVGRLLLNGTVVANFEADPGQRIMVDYLTAGNMSICRNVFSLVGGFDARMDGMGYEELDLGMRVKRAGYTLVFEPRAVVVHQAAPRPRGVSTRTGYTDPHKLYCHCRNLTYIRLTYLGLRWHPEYLWNTFLVQPRITLAMAMKRPSRRSLALFFSAVRGTVKGISYAMQTRKHPVHGGQPRGSDLA